MHIYRESESVISMARHSLVPRPSRVNWCRWPGNEARQDTENGGAVTLQPILAATVLEIPIESAKP